MLHETFSLRRTLTPTLSRKRERSALRLSSAATTLLPLAEEGGAKRRMRVSQASKTKLLIARAPVSRKAA